MQLTSDKNLSKKLVSRRTFLQKTALSGAGLTLAVTLPGCSSVPEQAEPVQQAAKNVVPQDGSPTPITAFVKIGNDDRVTILIKHVEFGQGTYTGIATLIAEELDADWDQVITEAAPVNTAVYINKLLGGQGTGGSTAIAASYHSMREAGAAARQMLVAAATETWNAPAEEISVVKGVISHADSGNTASFGELADAAAQQAVPESVTLKDPKDFTLIGNANLSRKDVGKTDGTAIFTQDVNLPNMLTAVVAHAPRFGAKVAEFDDTETRKVAGVVNVVEVPSGIAVLAETFWQAKTGRDALQIDWDYSEAMNISSDDLMASYKQLAKERGTPANVVGDVDAAFKGASKVVEASYEFPYLAHATMEPMNCVAQVGDDGVQLWYGCQGQSSDQAAVAAALGVQPEKVKIETLLAGGSFGRRSNTQNDYPIEAALIAKANTDASGESVPVKLVWTREDDQQSGYFRPMYFHKMKAGLDENGKIVAWHHHIVGQSILTGSRMEPFIKNGVDISTVEGAVNPPYELPNMLVEVTNTKSQVPVLWWRSVGSTHTAYATEVFMDEVAAAAGQDPLEFRQEHLIDDARHKGVLDLAVEKSGWASATKDGHVRGFALHKSFGSYVAQVVDLSVDGDSYRVDKITCAVDCGVAVNPDVIKAQIEGGIGYGLSPVFASESTVENGAVVETNFDRYQVLRISEMPEIDVHIVASAEPPTGVGEPGTPVVAPAVANALYAYNGKPRRKLPLGNKV